jgi:hypothetical protein
MCKGLICLISFVLMVGLGHTSAVAAPGDLLQIFLNPTPSELFFGKDIVPLGNNVLISKTFGSETYLFDPNGTVVQTYVGPEVNTYFKFGADIDGAGNHVLVGANRNKDKSGTLYAGAAYLFNASTGQLLHIFFSPQPLYEGHFGYGVALVGDDVLVGQFGGWDVSYKDRLGTAYLFDGSPPYELLETIENPNASLGDAFGISVAAVGGNILVGAPCDDTDGTNVGAAYLFDSNGTLLQTFHNPTPNANDYFGRYVAAMGEKVLVTAQCDDTGGINAGVTYLFDPNGALVQTFVNRSPQNDLTTLDYFQRPAVPVGNDVLVGNAFDDVGATDAGAAYLFDGSTGNLIHVFANPTPGEDESFGLAVGVLCHNIIVGDARDDTSGAFVGIAYLFAGGFRPFAVVTLMGPADGATVDTNGAILSCEKVEYAVSYQLLLGPAPNNMEYAISDTAAPPNEVITEFPYEDTYWTIRVRCQCGVTAIAEARLIHGPNEVWGRRTLEVPRRFQSIQAGIDGAKEADTIVVSPETYRENIDFKGKNVTVRSTNPADPAVAAATVIKGDGWNPVVTFSGGEREYCVLTGFTITDGNEGIYCSSASPTITNCSIVGNKDAGIDLWSDRPSNLPATITNCRIIDNAAEGIRADKVSSSITNCLISGNSADGIFSYVSRIPLEIKNCTIVENGGRGVFYERSHIAVISNCIIWDNLGSIIGAGASVVSYCDIEGGWPAGEGNIDIDPCFVSPGYLDANGAWVAGDYHCRASSACIDAGDNAALAADTGDLDGDGNTTEPIPQDLDGKARVIDGDNDSNTVVDMGAYEFFVPPIQVQMRFTPQALNAGSKGNWVKAHLVLPEGFGVGDVDTNTPAMVLPGGFESDHINVFVNEDGLVEAEAAFDRAAFCGYGTFDGTVTVEGALIGGRRFYGTDTIRIVTNNLKYLASLASHWLQWQCGKPDWCNGLDLNRDSSVNFEDFALFDGCCIEVVRE